MAGWLEILLWIGAGLWGLLLVQGALNGLLIPNVSKGTYPSPPAWPFVSFVVPARNEEWHLREAVTSFCTQDYPDYEVIVVNDRSTDGTGQILTELQADFARLQVLQGTEPPPGWLGKPNALELARAQARGEWILMVDADSRYAPDTLRRGLAFALQHDAAIATLRPRSESGGVLEAVLMSSVNFFFFVLTPLFLVNLTRSKLFATGSPVFNLIRRDAVDAVGGFACLKQAVVDDLTIGHCVKAAGFRQVVGDAGPLIKLRMYRSAAETVRGFTKTTFPTIRNQPYLLPLILLVGGILNLLPYVGFLVSLRAGIISVPATLSLALMHLVFAALAIRFREPWYVVFLNPVRELGWWWIFLRSTVIYYRKGVVWRDRQYASF